MINLLNIAGAVTGAAVMLLIEVLHLLCYNHFNFKECKNIKKSFFA